MTVPTPVIVDGDRAPQSPGDQAPTNGASPFHRGGLTFDEFSVGQRFVTAARTINEADVVLFAGLSGDFNPLHTDAVSAGQTPFGRRIAHGLLVVSAATGLANQLGIFQGTTLALLEQTHRYRGPVFFGDTIHLELEVQELRETSKPDRGVALFDASIVNQDGAAVIDGTWTLLLRRSAA
jgi:acyl dehydratase